MKISQNTPKMLKTKQTSFMNIYQIIIHTAGKQSPVLKRCFLLFILAAILQGAAIGMFVPFFISLGQEDYYHGLIWLSIMTLLSIFSLFSRWFGQDYDYKGYAAIAGNELRHKLGEHLRKIPLQTLHQRRTGEINAALAGNIDEVLNHTLMVSMMLINAVIIPFTVAVITLFFDWRMGFILLFIFPMIIPIYYCSRSLLERHKNNYVAAHAKLNAEVIEYVQGLPVLKASHCIGSKNDKIQSAAKHVEEVQRIALQKEMPANLLLGSAVELGLLLVIVLGVIWVVSGSLSIMLLSALIVAIIRFAEPLTSFLAVIAMYEIIKASFQRLQELQQIKPLPDTISSLLPKEYTIDFKSISFFYDNAKEASLKNISLTISQRSLTALVGSSGCGKTTLTRMIMRYADPQAGSLMIGGIDIRQISQEQLMSLISVVFQDVYLFDDSIFNNIRMGRSTATEDEVYAAAQQALCHDFIERLPQGYQTRVGDIGGRLSGGEKQRISIARALLKDAPIVILDEPTASLDTESEIAVQRAINTLVKNKTVIVIAHRLSTIMGAHNIVVLDKGKII